MAEQLIKNKRFKTGAMVDIHYAPTFETHTTAISDSTAGGVFKVNATIYHDISPEISAGTIEIGDLAAFSFGVGIIEGLSAFNITVNFPNSMFPDSNVMRYVGSEYQSLLFFKADERIMPNMQVARYSEEVSQATYGYAKTVYNLQSEARLTLIPLRIVDDGTLSQVLMSKGFVLKSCDDLDYDIDTGGWYSQFPLQLSGTSIDPIYRRAYMVKREIQNKGNRAKATMEFVLIG